MSDENKSRFAQCPIDEASWSSVTEQEPRSLREQIKSHEESTTTLIKAKREKEEENSKDYLNKAKEADSLNDDKQILEKKHTNLFSEEKGDTDGEHDAAQMEAEKNAKILADLKRFTKTRKQEDAVKLYISCMK